MTKKSESNMSSLLLKVRIWRLFVAIVDVAHRVGLRAVHRKVFCQDEVPHILLDSIFS